LPLVFTGKGEKGVSLGGGDKEKPRVFDGRNLRGGKVDYSKRVGGYETGIGSTMLNLEKKKNTERKRRESQGLAKGVIIVD